MEKAFLLEDLEEQCTEVPYGFREVSLMIKKSLYGLKQSPNFGLEVSTNLRDYCKGNYTLFIKQRSLHN